MEVNEAVRVEQRAASMRLVEMLAASDDQVIAYKAGLLAGLDPHSAPPNPCGSRSGANPPTREELATALARRRGSRP